MKLKLILTQKKLYFSLDGGRKQFDSDELNVDKSLSKNILPFLNSYLNKNGITNTDIKSVLLDSEIDDNFTSYRIVRVVLDSFFFASQLNQEKD